MSGFQMTNLPAATLMAFDSPQRAVERRAAEIAYENAGSTVLWSDASLDESRGAIAVVQAWPPRVLTARRARAKSVAKAEREALTAAFDWAYRLITGGASRTVSVLYDADNATTNFRLPNDPRITWECLPRDYNLAHSVAGIHRKRLA